MKGLDDSRRFKTCNHCGKSKPFTLYAFKNRNKSERHSECKDCRINLSREKRGLQPLAVSHFTGDKKTCTKCGEEKELSEFYAAKKGVGGVDSSCKDCKKSLAREKHRDKQASLGRVIKLRYNQGRNLTADEIKERDRWKEILKILG